MTTTFHNHTDTMLADAIGDIDAQAKAWCTQHSRTTPVTKLTVTVNRAALAQAA